MSLITRSTPLLGLALTLTLASAGCDQILPTAPTSANFPGGTSAGISTSGDVAELRTEALACVDEVNRMRGTLGKPPIAWSAEVQAFSDEAARVDGEAHDVHLHFRTTNGGHGAARAQNEIPWWKLSQWGSVRKVVREGLAMELAEGPGGGHFDSMTAGYTEMACGIAVINGEVTVTQDFR